MSETCQKTDPAAYLRLLLNDINRRRRLLTADEMESLFGLLGCDDRSEEKEEDPPQ